LSRASLDILGPGNPDTDADAIAGYDFDPEVENASDWPSGCYKTSFGVWFNEHPTGSTDPDAAPICAKDMEPVVTGGVLWIGDSDTDYWENTGSIAPSSHNVAVGGYTCEDVLNYFDTIMETFAPSKIIMTCGENDLADDATVDATFARFSTIVDKVVAMRSTLIAFGTKDEPDTRELWQKYADYDSRIMTLAESLSTNIASEPSLVFVDVNAGFKGIGNPSSLYAEDELHLSSEGYALWDTWASLALAEAEGNASCVIWRSGDCGPVLILPDAPSSSPSSSSIKESSKYWWLVMTIGLGSMLDY
jgi:lysophospholipase L1-like esterase